MESNDLLNIRELGIKPNDRIKKRVWEHHTLFGPSFSAHRCDVETSQCSDIMDGF